MSSSSSDSDSDDYEPIRKIKINIRPKDEVIGRDSVDINAIKASVEAWRPLGPPPNPSLSRRQSSISSISSMSFGASNSGNSGSTVNASYHGTTLHNSPSCSSLVNEFNNRSSFSNFMSTTSRTSSPLTLSNIGDTVPIAIAIQESIELTVKEHFDPNATEPSFESRLMGNIKVAFPNTFVRAASERAVSPLKLLMHSNNNITRYYTSGLIKDINLDTNNADHISIGGRSSHFSAFEEIIHDVSGTLKKKEELNNLDSLFSENPTGGNTKLSNKTIEFNMETLTSHLKMLYDKSPSSRYYNVDVLRYRISPLKSIQESPLQVCAYWKVEARMIKLKIDFKHSNKSGFNLERLREVVFTVNLANFIPRDMEINSLSPNSVTNLNLTNNNNNISATNMNTSTRINPQPSHILNPTLPLIDYLDNDRETTDTLNPESTPPVTSPIGNRSVFGRQTQHATDTHFMLQRNNCQPINVKVKDPWNDITGNSTLNAIDDYTYRKDSELGDSIPPYITYEPQANWNNSIKQLSWRFDTLLSFHKTKGFGSLKAKLDFRNHPNITNHTLQNPKPNPVDVKFLVADSTLSKVNLSVESLGYRLALLKREIRSARYRSEPYVM